MRSRKRKAAPGVDGMTWHDYEADLEPRIEDLHGQVHRGAYRPQPSRRTYIPKADGLVRPVDEGTPQGGPLSPIPIIRRLRSFDASGQILRASLSLLGDKSLD